MPPPVLKPRQALNKAFLKVKPNRADIDRFKAQLTTLLDRANDRESEEFHKNLVADFLKKTYYDPGHFINTKGRNDLVVHNGPEAKSPVGVILETKKPTNRAEMPTPERLNVKAFHELVLYYLRERITHKNLEVKHLVITNLYEWFIFDATVLDRLFAQDRALVAQFNDFEGGRLADTRTDFFYRQIAEPLVAQLGAALEFTYFNLQDYQAPLRNADPADDHALIVLYKLLSPGHLLKLPFANDSNSLDKHFYSELLHLIGLTETKDGGKKLIERNPPGQRHSGSLLEDTIIQLDSLEKLGRLDKPHQYGSTTSERQFNVALELCITWVNRILFLKLLEAQLISYHQGDRAQAFLHPGKLKDFDDLNSLFFQVLARQPADRNDDVKLAFAHVPYLNSSLFEPTDLEQVTLVISNLRDDKPLPIFGQTVLKDPQGKRRTGQLTTLRYLFEFLDAYDFSGEGSEEIQEDNKTLINASVLGLIFEKINGYKDGSFFTPGFITMYMCRETIRRAVVQKFNEAVGDTPLTPLKRGNDTPLAPLKRGNGPSVLGEDDTPEAEKPSLEGGKNTPLNPLSRGDFPTAEGETPLLRGAGGVSLGGAGGVSEEGFKSVPEAKPRRQIIPYNPHLKELARQLRNNSTKTEIILWKELKGKFEGKYDFHRQKPLDNFIADFFCHELMLVIELDGESHNWEETQQKDFAKECRLNELGINVLRFPDAEIYQNLDGTLDVIRQYIEGYERGDLSAFRHEDTPLNPLSGGEFALPDVPLTYPPAPDTLLNPPLDTPLNPLLGAPLNPPLDTPLNPLSRGDFPTAEGETPHLRGAFPNAEGETPHLRGAFPTAEGETPLLRGAFPNAEGETPLLRGAGGVSLGVPGNGPFHSLDDIYDQIGEGRLFTRQQANDLINSLKICDPAVGSGHFLVSALNEIIAVKHDLKILQDRQGRRLKEYQVEVVNDELVITDDNGQLFEYNPLSKESQRVQETFFHEKQTIIENCLFGVDINPNSVKICRLRLWIELLKHAYYTPLAPLKRGEDTPTAPLKRGEDTPPAPLKRGDLPEAEKSPLERGFRGVSGRGPSGGSERAVPGQLETLPNIDINIKTGNSLVSRFALDADLGQALKKSQWNIGTYRAAVATYRNAQNKEQKHEMERLIASIKADFRSEIARNDPKMKKLSLLKGDLLRLTTQQNLFGMSEREKADWEKKTSQLTVDIQKLDAEIAAIQANKIYENAFEWRFEFPEVLSPDGDFVGFDVVIGNPPYIRQEEFTELKPHLKSRFEIFAGTADLYVYFVELGMKVLRSGGDFTFIIPNKWMRAGYGKTLRNYVKSYSIMRILDFGDLPVFEEATTYPCILQLMKAGAVTAFKAANINTLEFPHGLGAYAEEHRLEVLTSELTEEGWTIADSRTQKLLAKLKQNSKPLGEYVGGKIFYGIKTGFNEAFVIDEATKNRLIAEDPNSAAIIKPFLAGRDIKRYQQPTSDKYLIFTRRGIEIEKYPAILNHLQNFRTYLEPKPKNHTGNEWLGRKSGTYKWYEIQDAVDYYEEFEKGKIMLPDIAIKAECLIDLTGSYCVNTAYIIPITDYFLLGLLNSSLTHFFYSNLTSSIRGGYLRFTRQYIEQIPVVMDKGRSYEQFETLVDQILNAKQSDPSADTTALEQQIDQLVYQLYGLSPEEIRLVEGS